MSFSRNLLKGLGLSEEQQTAVIEAHQGEMTAVKEERDRYREEADAGKKSLEAVRKQLDELKKADAEGWKSKHDELKASYDKLKADSEQYKADVEAKAARAAKETAVRAYLESKSVTGKGLAHAMRDSSLLAALEKVELGNDGKIKDASALDTLISGDLADFVSTRSTIPADSPPASAPSGGTSYATLADAMKAKNENPTIQIDYSKWLPPAK